MRLITLGSFILSIFWVGQSVASEKVRFAPLPMESLGSMSREYLPFMDFLETELKTPFELVYKKSYQALISSFTKGEIDLAYLGPLPYVVLKEQFPDAIPLAAFLDSEGKSTYTCALVEFAGSPISLDSDQQKKVALTQPLSTCGYLAVESLLNQTNQSLEQADFSYQFIGSHSKVAEDVVLGHYQMGGLKTQIGKKYHHLGLRIVQESDPMPGFIMVANAKTLNSDKIAQIKALILSIKPSENPDHFEKTKPWGSKIKYGSIPVNDNVYNSVREKWKNTQIDLMTQ